MQTVADHGNFLRAFFSDNGHFIHIREAAIDVVVNQSPASGSLRINADRLLCLEDFHNVGLAIVCDAIAAQLRVAERAFLRVVGIEIARLHRAAVDLVTKWAVFDGLAGPVGRAL